MRILADKQRLDVLLFDKGLAPSREKARLLIMEGKVYVDNQKSDKPGTMVNGDCTLDIRGNTLEYVSRGGLKLEKALKSYPIDLTSKTCMDIGASTGGFTDCMLKNGAETIYSIDVGYGQLAWELRNDKRVINLERTNVRYLSKEQVPVLVDFFSIDVSFISLKLIIPAISDFIKDQGEGVCLIKPQFEAGKKNVGKNGVVRDIGVHEEVIKSICEFIPLYGFSTIALTFSPIKGPKGNIEYLLYVKKAESENTITEDEIKQIVALSHTVLNNE